MQVPEATFRGLTTEELDSELQGPRAWCIRDSFPSRWLRRWRQLRCFERLNYLIDRRLNNLPQAHLARLEGNLRQ